MRLFIATDLSEEVKQEIERIKQPFAGIKGVKPVRKENIHVTLKFLGEVYEDKVDQIKDALAHITFEPFYMSLNKIGCFPDEKRIRVLWVDAEPAKPLADLKKKIDAALPNFIDDYKEFNVHLTFARIKYFASKDDKKKMLELLTNIQVEKKEFYIDKFKLYQSTLTPEGSIFKVLESYPKA